MQVGRGEKEASEFKMNEECETTLFFGNASEKIQCCLVVFRKYMKPRLLKKISGKVPMIYCSQTNAWDNRNQKCSRSDSQAFSVRNHCSY